MTTVRRVLVTIAVALSSTVAQAEAAPILFGATTNGRNGLSDLYTINIDTGAATLVGPIGFARVSAMDYIGGKLFATAKSLPLSTITPVLITIDTKTGAGTEVGLTGISSVVTDMSFRHSDGTLFAYDGIAVPFAFHKLNTLNTSTGGATLVGATGLAFDAGNGMAFSLDDTLFHVSRDDGLHTIDQVNGTVSSGTAVTYPAILNDFGKILAMDVHPSTGVMYAAARDDDAGHYLTTLDTASATVSVVGLSVDGLDALAFSQFSFPTAASAIYTVIDDDSGSGLDGLGDIASDRLLKPGGFVGEVDTQDTNRIGRLVAKFALPPVDEANPVLESAKLRFFVTELDGTPAGPVSLFHSVEDNDQDLLASDYEETSYIDTDLDLVGPTDEAGRFYELDVTNPVLADYAADSDSPLSAFRLQVTEAIFSEDDLSARYRFTMPGFTTPGGGANGPRLVLTFAEDSSIIVGDMDCDGDVDFDDIDDFVLGLNNPQDYENQFGVPPEAKGDTDGDGDLDFDDIDDFVGIINNPFSAGPETVPEPGTAALLGVTMSVLGLCTWRRGKGAGAESETTDRDGKGRHPPALVARCLRSTNRRWPRRSAISSGLVSRRV